MNGERDPMGTWAPWHHRINVGWIISLMFTILGGLAIMVSMGGEWQ